MRASVSAVANQHHTREGEALAQLLDVDTETFQ